MKLELLGRSIFIENRIIKWKSLKLNIDKKLKSLIFSEIKDGLTEWAIKNSEKKVVWWWSIKPLSKNPLLR